MSPRIESVTALKFEPALISNASPADWRDHFIYFLIVDRFDNNADDIPLFDDSVTPVERALSEGQQFQGGNIKGITRRLDYIKGLGCSTIWLSPILKNRLDQATTYHGYGIHDFLEVDPRFGTLDDLQELTREAHLRGMYVILDVVLNHAGDVFYYQGGGSPCYSGQTHEFGGWIEGDPAPGLQVNDAVWPVELQRPEAYKRKGQICHWENPEEAKNGDFLSLKELDIGKAEVLDTLIKVYKYWLSEADLDGFRIDTVKHMEESATAIFCNAIREYAQRIGKHNFFLFGEIVASDHTIQRYLGRNTRIDGSGERFPSLDAALDFPLYFNLEEVIKGFSNPAVLRARYDTFHNIYADHGEAGRYFVTFIDNHDQMVRPYRRFLHNNPFQDQTVQAMGYLLTSQGIPCIYYGTEQGFDGGGTNDACVRETMFGGTWGAFGTIGHHFFNQEHPIYKGIKEIAKLRKNEPALRYGRQYFREISGDGEQFGHPIDGHCTLAYSRILDSEEVLIALNLDHQPRNDWITVDRHLSAPGRKMKNLLSGDEHIIDTKGGRASVRIAMKPRSITIWKVV